MYVVLHSILKMHADLLVLNLKPVWNRSVQITSEASSTVRISLQDNNAHLSFFFYPKQIQHRQILLHFFTAVSDTTHCPHRDWKPYCTVAMWWHRYTANSQSGSPLVTSQHWASLMTATVHDSRNHLKPSATCYIAFKNTLQSAHIVYSCVLSKVKVKSPLRTS
jgi:hypothetical protein